jgi:hypothetical protein
MSGRVSRGMPLLFVCLVAVAGCSGSDTPAVTTPSATRTTDTFSGTVVIGGHDFHSFGVAAAGTVDVTLTAAAPPATIAMGINIGIPGDGQCPPIAGGSAMAAAASSVQLSGVASPSTLCVDVHDIGNQSAPVSYTVTVTHP